MALRQTTAERGGSRVATAGIDRAVSGPIVKPAAANPAEDFAAAAMVVSPHGGVLADLVFCRPGTKVLELPPIDQPAPYYYTLSLAAGLEYGCLVSRSLHERPEAIRTPSTSDFTVDIDELAAALIGMQSYE